MDELVHGFLLNDVFDIVSKFDILFVCFLYFLLCAFCMVFLIVVARFDFSWGEPEYHQETLENLKLAVKSTKKLCAVCVTSYVLFLIVTCTFL